MSKQDRRVFLKSSLLALCGALAPFRSTTDPVSAEVLAKGFVPKDKQNLDIFSTYVVDKGMIFFAEPPATLSQATGLLVQGVTLTYAMHRTQPAAEVKLSIQRLIGPSALIDAFTAFYSNVDNWEKNVLVFKPLENGGKPVDYFVLMTKMLLTNVGAIVRGEGMSVVASALGDECKFISKGSAVIKFDITHDEYKILDIKANEVQKDRIDVSVQVERPVNQLELNFVV